MLELGTLGQAGLVPGGRAPTCSRRSRWSRQIRDVLERYEQAGRLGADGDVRGVGHGPHVDAAERWLEIATEFWAGA